MEQKGLPGDIVGLIAIYSRPVGYICASGQVNSDIADCHLACKAQHGDTNDDAHAIEKDYRSSESVF